ncbi:CLUMA_CG002439, isoform A [Clunio marinus]|uniref:CLUMA_CG002439, isoform A n=1 Tax=Clunio marinus TaxID=568069 RepID=A0A1J1HKX7_9DIPT|nr:CLUMA_CG002439, isoform A [Clunio marinus]
MKDSCRVDFREIQRRNGKIIIRALMGVEKATVNAIVEKICCEHNIIVFKNEVEKEVKSFIYRGYKLGFIDVTEDSCFVINHRIKEQFTMAKQHNKTSKVLKSHLKRKVRPKQALKKSKQSQK